MKPIHRVNDNRDYDYLSEMLEKIIIRKANRNDLDTLLYFEQDVIEAERSFDPTLKKKDIHYYDLKEMLAAAHIALLVAEMDGVLIGSGYARIENAKPYLQHNKHAYLGFIYVVPGYRGKGVNKAIIEALEKWAQKQGVTELRLDVYFQNSSAIKAYEKAGFSSHMIEMRKRL